MQETARQHLFILFRLIHERQDRAEFLAASLQDSKLGIGAGRKLELLPTVDMDSLLELPNGFGILLPDHHVYPDREPQGE